VLVDVPVDVLVRAPGPTLIRSMSMAPLSRAERITERGRNPKWRNAPLRIEMSECINCDTCIRHCPPQFGAIFNHGIDVIIVPELCSGCGKCLDPCPVDCIYEDPDWTPAPEDWWEEPFGSDDPYGRPPATAIPTPEPRA
jgi:electron transport complex protein RnfB